MIKLIAHRPFGGSFEIGAGRHVIGRDPMCTVCLNDASVSHHHCELFVDPLVVIVTDLGSTNGTFIEGVPVTSAELTTGQRLQVGQYTLMLERDIPSVVVPSLPVPQPEAPSVFEDGTPCCYNHPAVHPTRQCCGCGRVFCEACVTKLGLVGGQRHALCPVCHNHCTVYNPAAQSGAGWLRQGVTALKRGIAKVFRSPRPSGWQ